MLNMGLHRGSGVCHLITCRDMEDRYSIGGDDAAQKSVSLASCGDVLHQSIFLGLSCLHWEGV